MAEVGTYCSNSTFIVALITTTSFRKCQCINFLSQWYIHCFQILNFREKEKIQLFHTENK